MATFPTLVFVVLTVLSIANPDLYFSVAVLDSVLFGLGLLCFAGGFFTAVLRSRYLQVSLAGAFFLVGEVVTVKNRRLFRAVLAVQVLFGLLGAVWRPFTELAFGVLVPMLGLGQMAIFGGLCGNFPKKDSD